MPRLNKIFIIKTKSTKKSKHKSTEAFIIHLVPRASSVLYNLGEGEKKPSGNEVAFSSSHKQNDQKNNVQAPHSRGIDFKQP